MGSGDNRLLGTWKLHSCTFVDAETGKQSNPLGVLRLPRFGGGLISGVSTSS